MIEHSDNTATDMLLKFVGPDNVRSLIATAQLKNTAIPDSLRSFFGYLLNAKNYQTFSWADICAAANSSLVNPPLNKVLTLASSAADSSPTTPAPSRANSSRTTPPSLNTAGSSPPATPSGSPAPPRRQRLLQRRQHRRPRTSRRLRPRGNALRRPLGILRLHSQLVSRGRNRPRHSGSLRQGHQPGHDNGQRLSVTLSAEHEETYWIGENIHRSVFKRAVGCRTATAFPGPLDGRRVNNCGAARCAGQRRKAVAMADAG